MKNGEKVSDSRIIVVEIKYYRISHCKKTEHKC